MATFAIARRLRDNCTMPIWTTLVAAAARAFDPEADPPTPGEACAPEEGDVGFTAAVVGLAAKMAKADGEVTGSEVNAAARVFRPPPGEEAAFRRVFAIAKQSVHGFESYAKQIGRKYKARPCLLEDVLDGLFHIAAADGLVGSRELAYLETVATHFGFSPQDFRRIKAINLGMERDDPYAVLGLMRGASFEEVREAWRRLARENHPDQMASRGAPAAFVAIAHAKSAALNAAYGAIRAEMAVSLPGEKANA
jgi:DnaJ like chaperone protein